MDDKDKPKYLVELFITERIVVTVEADDEDDAYNRATKSLTRTHAGALSVVRKNGVVSTHFDEDYDYTVKRGDVIEDDD